MASSTGPLAKWECPETARASTLLVGSEVASMTCRSHPSKAVSRKFAEACVSVGRCWCSVSISWGLPAAQQKKAP